VVAQESPLTARPLQNRGCLLETTSPEEACDAYRAALNWNPSCGRPCEPGPLLHEVGDVYAALCTIGRRSRCAGRHHRGLQRRGGPGGPGATVTPSPPIDARWNASAQPRRALNLARLLEQDGKPDLAVRHLLL